ncbi:hypothetical protein [Paenarthrobacter sp. TA1.8]|uniref:hypothetical protein n=1 Tax=Paenarthrobacter sp. TA1.8 TaxID=3400219 RepID=UPI003B435E28
MSAQQPDPRGGRRGGGAPRPLRWGILTKSEVDALLTAADAVHPDAVPISNSIAGRGVAGVFAARTRSGLEVDAMGVCRDAEGIVAHQSVYGGAYTSTPR